MWTIEMRNTSAVFSDGIVSIDLSWEEALAVWAACGRLLGKLSPADFSKACIKFREHPLMPVDIVTPDPSDTKAFFIRLWRCVPGEESVWRRVEYRIDRESAEDLLVTKDVLADRFFD